MRIILFSKNNSYICDVIIKNKKIMETKDKQKFIDEFTKRIVKEFNEFAYKCGVSDAFIELGNVVSSVILCCTLNIDDAHKAAEVLSKEIINSAIDNYYKCKKENAPS